MAYIAPRFLIGAGADAAKPRLVADLEASAVELAAHFASATGVKRIEADRLALFVQLTSALTSDLRVSLPISLLLPTLSTRQGHRGPAAEPETEPEPVPPGINTSAGTGSPDARHLSDLEAPVARLLTEGLEPMFWSGAVLRGRSQNLTVHYEGQDDLNILRMDKNTGNPSIIYWAVLQTDEKIFGVKVNQGSVSFTFKISSYPFHGLFIFCEKGIFAP
ncbi:unnamed protein product [Protopolystoma xenopodis]|uniref:Uncharacterized protein n=1 Tax=Protopolystoma xenopodis TaxID=117903 RepID=A0A3S5C5C0_9PLAT|nr:unnamed protein product [Protopolystoma xenopodis]